MSRRSSLPAIALAVLVLPGCGTAQLSSVWRADPLHPDGSVASWRGVEYESDAGIQVGVINDDENLYVRLIPENQRAQMQLLRGVTVWIGGEEEEERVLGLRIMPGDGMPALPRGGGGGDRGSPPDPSGMAKRVAESLDELHVLSPQGMIAETRSLPAEHGVDVRIESTTVLAYVVRIPLHPTDSDHVAVGAGPGEAIRIGVEGEAMPERGTGGQRPSGGAPAGGGGGRGGRSGGFGSMGRGRPSPPEPVELWTTLELAQPGGAD